MIIQPFTIIRSQFSLFCGMLMQKMDLKRPVRPLAEIRCNVLSKINNLVKRANLLAQGSECPYLKVGYIAVDSEYKEVASAINKYRKNRLLLNSSNGPMNLLHAERELKKKIEKQAIEYTGLCAIGSHSPCQYCVVDLKSVGVETIVFSNLYWDTHALELAEQLGMNLLYSTSLGLSKIPSQVISGLSDLNITPQKNHTGRSKIINQDLVFSQRKMSYIKSHREGLIQLLNQMLMDFLRNSQNLDDSLFRTRVLKMRSQIDTEQECLRWAKMNVILTKHP